ncbi:nucleotidyltransferase [Pelosinus propionicus]|uniref:tRNA(Met) cytidine acetate ligase n=1 Tax=Pelosinus propionicus DSM 13327 TaxID=1123291 RepID=A0A1I4L9S2_9FIRM|nr:nucleotidyltransferase [Pelosinus propionicus]SFL87710.1 Predicted nucleotidyltransferase [Pelosinus propionicus DSM 13327]
MQAVGVIVEYNPFHNGHKWQIDAAKKRSGCPFVIGVMSGNFVQRGEPAIFDKWKRAEMAIRGGVDLIIELPTVFAVRSAQYFAAGSIRLLHSLGIVSHVCFGAEHADLELLKKIATATSDVNIMNQMHINLHLGNTYASALGQALRKHYNVAENITSSSNNILAIEYLRAIKEFSPALQPIAVTRQISKYNDTTITSSFASATAIRQAIIEYLTVTDKIKLAVPETTSEVLYDLLLQKYGPVTLHNFSSIILAQLRLNNSKQLEKIPGVSEGLHYKIHDSSLLATNIDHLLSLLKSKRYTYTRLQRILIHALLGTTQEQLANFDKEGPLYARILAFNQNGRLLIKKMNQHNTIPVITKTTHYLSSKQRDNNILTPLQQMLSVDTLASDIYSLGIPSSNLNMGAWDFRYPALYIPT